LSGFDHLGNYKWIFDNFYSREIPNIGKMT